MMFRVIENMVGTFFVQKHIDQRWMTLHQTQKEDFAIEMMESYMTTERLTELKRQIKRVVITKEIEYAKHSDAI